METPQAGGNPVLAGCHTLSPLNSPEVHTAPRSRRCPAAQPQQVSNLIFSLGTLFSKGFISQTVDAVLVGQVGGPAVLDGAAAIARNFADVGDGGAPAPGTEKFLR